MCSFSDERPDLYQNSLRKARKEHRCSECGRMISPGETYGFAKMLYDGYWGSFNTCAHCLVGQRWLGENCGGWMHDGLAEEIEEHAEEYRHLRFRMTLYRKHMRQQWRSPAGGLRSVPAMFPPAEIAA